MKTKPTFSALGAPMSRASVHESPRVDELELPKSSISASTRRHPVGLPRRYRDFQDGGNLYDFRQRASSSFSKESRRRLPHHRTGNRVAINGGMP